MSIQDAIAVAVEGHEIPAELMEAAFCEIMDGKAGTADTPCIRICDFGD